MIDILSLEKLDLLLENNKFYRLFSQQGFLGALKSLEVAVLGKYASTYCYNPPDTVFIEPTNRCQLSCKYCYRNHVDLMNPDLGMISFEDFKRVADNLKGVRRLYIMLGGEPLLHKDFVRMLQYVRDKRVAKRWGTVTNGMLLGQEMADRILDVGISFLCVSLDGSDAETHEKARIGSSFEKVTKNLSYFSRNAPRKTRVYAFATVTTESLASFERMPEMLKDMGVKRLIAQQLLIRTSDAKDLREEHMEDSVGRVREKCQRLGIEFIYYANPPKKICYEPFRRFAVTFDGKIPPCCQIETMGISAAPYEVEGFWNGPGIRKWRKRVLERDYPEVCQVNCDLEGYENKLTL